MPLLEASWFATGIILGIATSLATWIIWGLAHHYPEPPAADDLSSPDVPSRRWDDIDLEYRTLTTSDHDGAA